MSHPKQLVLGLAAVVVLALAAPLHPQESVNRYVRVATDGGGSYGILDGETVRLMAGDDLFHLMPTAHTLPLYEAKLLAPIDPDRVQKVIGVAVNTRRPSRMEPIPHPRVFAKFPTSVRGPGDAVELPPEAGNLNYEGELVLVIGREGRHIPESHALEYVFGVTAGNDFSENTWYSERGGPDQPTRLVSKGTDSWAPIGPAIVTGLDYLDLAVETRLNGAVVQRGRTSDLVNGVANLVSYVSRYITLKPGDLIFTGTVGRVEGARVRMEPGDVLEVEIEGIGILRNHIVPMDERPTP